jgi:hypothetical protein
VTGGLTKRARSDVLHGFLDRQRSGRFALPLADELLQGRGISPLTGARDIGLASVVNEFDNNVIAELDYYGEALLPRRSASGQCPRRPQLIQRVHIDLGMCGQLTVPSTISRSRTDAPRVT